MWNQVYNPFNNAILSTLAAAIPVVALLAMIASNKVKVHIAAIIALIIASLPCPPTCRSALPCLGW